MTILTYSFAVCIYSLRADRSDVHSKIFCMYQNAERISNKHKNDRYHTGYRSAQKGLINNELTYYARGRDVWLFL